MSRAHAIGKAAVELSRLGLGTMAIGGQHVAVTDEAATAVVDAAWAAGIRFFDAAPQYGCGLAEERLGLALRSRPRAQAIVASKVGKRIAPVGSGGQRQKALIFPGGHDGEMVFDYSYDGTLRTVEASLARLGMTYLDIALIHDVTRHFHGEHGVDDRYREALAGAVKALQRLRGEGVVRAIGTGLKDVDIAARFIAEAQIDVVLLPGRVTLLDQTGITSGLLDLCCKHNVAVVAAGPFDSGILATGAVAGASYGYRPAEVAVLDRVARIGAICRDNGVPLQAAALQFPALHAAVASVLAGMRTPDEVRQNAQWMRAPVPAALWAALAAAGLVTLPEDRAGA